MQHKMKRQVTPSFLRNIRKGFLDNDGNPVAGKEHQAAVLLDTMLLVQDGRYFAAMLYAATNGFPLAEMRSEYIQLTRRSREGKVDFEAALQEWEAKHNCNMVLRVAS